MALLLSVASGCTSPSEDVKRTVPAAVSDEARAALNLLDLLAVLPKRPNIAGYERGCSPSQACTFGPAWSDDTSAPGSHNGCDTRNDVLLAQLRNPVLRAGSDCVVVAGELDEPFTGRTVQWQKSDGGSLQVDHIVPLAYAYDAGASAWTQDERAAFANDPDLVLLLVDGAQNQSKGDSGPSTWMPPNRGFWCDYDIRFVQILAHYSLSVVAADRDAIRSVLATCD
ncbi:MAG: putative lipoprotein [Jatrophihabitantaceae bacterium]|nr:putative lipoprotein [Jatrophihabitantaceae bacterium]